MFKSQLVKRGTDGDVVDAALDDDDARDDDRRVVVVVARDRIARARSSRLFPTLRTRHGTRHPNVP